MNGTERSIRTIQRSRRGLMPLLLLLAAAMVLAACGSTLGARASPSGPSGGGSSGMGPGITVDEARASGSDQPLLVKGYLVRDAQGNVTLCSALAESDPPQCGGSSLSVEGLDLSCISRLTSRGGVTWSTSEVKLTGSLRNGVLTVSSTTSG